MVFEEIFVATLFQTHFMSLLIGLIIGYWLGTGKGRTDALTSIIRGEVFERLRKGRDLEK